jgi:hypothetical protein
MSYQAHQAFPIPQLPASASLERSEPYKLSNTSNEQAQDITEDLHTNIAHDSTSEDPLTPLLEDDEVPFTPNGPKGPNPTSTSISPQKSTFSRLSMDEEKSVCKLLPFGSANNNQLGWEARPLTAQVTHQKATTHPRNHSTMHEPCTLNNSPWHHVPRLYHLPCAPRCYRWWKSHLS